MGIFDRLFGAKAEKSEKISKEMGIVVGGSSNDPILEAANLIHQKQIDSAICLLEGLRDTALSREDSGMKYLHLGIAYAKKGDAERSNMNFRKAIDFGHPSGLAYEKLAISLTKLGKIEEAIQVCQELIDHPSIPQRQSYLSKDDMRKRKERLLAMLAKKRGKGTAGGPATGA